MNKRPGRLPIGERVRPRWDQRRPPTAPTRKRRVSRREREARRKRQLYLGMTGIGLLVVLILAIGLTNEYVIKPRHVLATVDGTKLRRQEYWKVRSFELIEQAQQYTQFASFFEGQPEQQQQYLGLAAQAQAELETVWGSTDTNDTTLTRMIDDQVYLKNIDDLGLSVTNQDVDQYILQQFAPADAPLITPTPTPTLIPERAAWATQTAEAAVSPTPTPAASSPAPLDPSIASPVADASSASPLPAEGTPMGAGDVVPEGLDGSPSPSNQVDASPTAPSMEEGTPNPDQARATSEAAYDQFTEVQLDRAHMSRADYARLIARPAVARQKVTDVLEAQIGQRAEQVHAAHILVGTEDLARSIREQLNQPGANFEQIAREQSTDTATAPNGGDLGWFTRNAMVEPFADAAFNLAPGSISDPVQSSFGWHIIKVYDHQADRPLTDEQIQRLKDDAVQEWLNAQKAETDIDADIEPTPTSAPEQFQPPPGAPPTPTIPLASPVTGAPEALASPEAVPVGSPAG